MKPNEFKSIAEKSMANFNLSELKAWVLSLKDKTDIGDELIFEAGLNLLRQKMVAKDFVEFCEAL